MNDLEKHLNAFDGIEPFAGEVPKGFLIDFLGQMTDARFLPLAEQGSELNHPRFVETSPPRLEDGEIWFEAVNWCEAARDARDHYVMITLGGNYGNQTVGSYLALQALSSSTVNLVAVEGMPENAAWIREHYVNNGIDPGEHWTLEVALSSDHQPVIFPVGSPGSGAQNCLSTNNESARQSLAQQIIASHLAAKVLEHIMTRNSTGVEFDLVPGYEPKLAAELRFISALTLADVLGPFSRVDYLESDIQQSEIIIFPPTIELLSRKVRRVHIGTHGAEVHTQLHNLFENAGWEMIFSFPPETQFDTPHGTFQTNDGVLTALNPALE